MGQQQPTKKPIKKRSLQQQSRIQGLYEMYAQSIRLSTLIKSQSVYEQSQNNKNNSKLIKTNKILENSQQFLQQLLLSFIQKGQYVWATQIRKLFLKHFRKDFQKKWYQSKEFFYQLLLQNIGIQPQSHELVNKSHIVLKQKQKKLNQLKGKQKNKQKEQQKSFQNYFHKIIKQRSKHNIKSSFIMGQQDHIDRRKQQQILQIAQVQSQRMTLQQQINYVNSSIIDIEEQKIFSDPNINKNISQYQNDDQYFLPLITKRNKFKKQKASERNSLQGSQYISQPLIQMSHFQPKAKYSRYRLQSSSVILPSTVFYQRMNFSAKVQTDQLLKIYRQLSNTIQQTINSCNLISCPLKHFILYFQFKTSKKNINQLNRTSSTSMIQKSNINIQNLSSTSKKTSDSMKNIQIIPSNNMNKRSSSFGQSSIPQNQQLYNMLIQMSQKTQIIRKKRQYNTNYLLKQIKQFSQAYTQFLFKYLNFTVIQQTDLQNFINLDTVYGIVLRNIWNIVSWIADRGYQWEQYALKDIAIKQNPQFQKFTQQQITQSPSIIIQKYAKFCNKDVKKIKIQAQKFIKAYISLLKLKNQVFPQKYLKKIIIFYRQATKCCQGADDLMTLYEFLLKNCILNEFTEQMHIFRMKNIIDKLIPIESSSIDGAGQIVYAWTTWNIILQMFYLKLNEYKQVLLLQTQQNQRNKQKLHHTERKNQNPNSKINNLTQIKYKQNRNSKIRNINENPQKKPIKKLQY